MMKPLHKVSTFSLLIICLAVVGCRDRESTTNTHTNALARQGDVGTDTLGSDSIQRILGQITAVYVRSGSEADSAVMMTSSETTTFVGLLGQVEWVKTGEIFLAKGDITVLCKDAGQSQLVFIDVFRTNSGWEFRASFQGFRTARWVDVAADHELITAVLGAVQRGR